MAVATRSNRKRLTAHEQLARAKAEVRRAETRLRRDRGRRKITCASCAQKHEIRTLDAIQTHFYVEPYGCTGGAYWNCGELQYVCPVSKVRNRILFFDFALEQRFRQLYSSLFHSVTDAYDDEDTTFGRAWVNNDDVLRRRDAFELTAAART